MGTNDLLSSKMAVTHPWWADAVLAEAIAN